MSTTSNLTSPRRKYTKRSDEERIAELEQRIQELKARQQAQEKKDDPVLRDIPKIQRRLRKFAQLAAQHRRLDIANSCMAFIASLDRILTSELRLPAPPPIETEP
ncbi:MAG: hypothetical protein O7B99_05125 [Planctomycetota bacterium]|nr:hypothetical protein [Planctomycetota bacterium]